MSERYGWYGAAALAFVLVLLSFFLIPYRSEHQSERRDAQEAERNVSEEYIKLRCDRLPVADRPLCAAQEAHAAAEKMRNEYDLKAQQEMAEWALLVVVASVLSLFVSIGGLGALIWTFREQRKTSENQARAYIEVVTGRTNVSKFKVWSIDITVMNTGQTPAFDVTMTATMRFYPRSNDRKDEVAPKISFGVKSEVNEIGPSALDTFSFYKNTSFLFDEISNLRNARGEIIGSGEENFPYVEISGSVSYRDAFDKMRTVNFLLQSIDILDFDTYQLLGGSERGYEQEMFRIRHEARSKREAD